MANVSKRDKAREKASIVAAKNRRELIAAGFNRRDLLKMGLLTSAGMLIPKIGLSARPLTSAGFVDDTPESRPTTPFVEEMPRLVIKQPTTTLTGSTPQLAPNTAGGESRTVTHQAFTQFPPQKFFEIHQKAFLAKSSPDFVQPTTLWGFDGVFPGPLLVARYGEPILVRQFNDLPANNNGFGINSTTTHLHNGHATDGLGVWVANNGDDTVTKLSMDGAMLGTFAVGNGPQALLITGKYVWVANEKDGSVTKLSRDGAVLGTFKVGQRPVSLATDGTNIWVADNQSDSVMKLSAAGEMLATYSVGDGPFGLAFDGTNIWVTNFFSRSVMKLNPKDGTVITKAEVGDGAAGIAINGGDILVVNNGSNSLTVLSKDGTVVSTLKVGISPYGVAVTSSGLWVTNAGSDSISRR